MATQSPLSSTKAIQSTIETDALVFRWFLYLLSQDKVKGDLNASGQAAVYGQLKKAVVIQRFCSFGFLGILIYVLLTKQYVVFAAAVVLLAVYFRCHRIVRRHVARLGLKIIAKHFKTDDIGRHTLYQIGERLANQYHVKSLVMSITSVDSIVRRALLLTLIFASCIFPLKFLPFFGLVLAVYWVTRALINTTIVYKRLS